MSRKRRRRQSTAAAGPTTTTSSAAGHAPAAVSGAPQSFPTSAPARVRRRWGRFCILIAVLGGLIALKHVWWPPAFRSLARVELRQGHIEEGLAWLDYVDWLVPDDPATALLRARGHRKLGEMNQVETYIKEARAEGAAEDAIHREQVLAYAQSGQLSRAEPYLGELLSDQTDDVDDVCEAYVIGYMRTQRFNEALMILDPWIEDSPDLALPHLLLGRIMAFRQEYGAAETAFRKAIEIDPRLHAARLDLGQVLATSNRFEEAIQLLEQCLDSPQTRADAMIELGICYNSIGEGAQARDMLQTAVAESPGNALAHLELGRIQFEAGDYSVAVSTLNRAIELDPRNDEAHYVLAQALTLNDQLEEAKPHFDYIEEASAAFAEIDSLNERLLQNPRDVEALVRAGELYLKFANAEEGVVRLLSALDLDPENQTARRLLVEHYEVRAAVDPAYSELEQAHRRHLR
jgi:tetratricopeptide (TPR) repeat protein